jgi:hypothetical protein
VHEDPDLALEVFVLEPEQNGEQDAHKGSLAEQEVSAIEPD